VIRRLGHGSPDRSGVILEVRGNDGGPPYLVEWSDDGRVGLVYPSEEAHVEHPARSSEHGAPPGKAAATALSR